MKTTNYYYYYTTTATSTTAMTDSGILYSLHGGMVIQTRYFVMTIYKIYRKNPDL